MGKIAIFRHHRDKRPPPSFDLPTPKFSEATAWAQRAIRNKTVALSCCNQANAQVFAMVIRLVVTSVIAILFAGYRCRSCSVR